MLVDGAAVAAGDGEGGGGVEGEGGEGEVEEGGWGRHGGCGVVSVWGGGRVSGVVGCRRGCEGWLWVRGVVRGEIGGVFNRLHLTAVFCDFDFRLCSERVHLCAKP